MQEVVYYEEPHHIMSQQVLELWQQCHQSLAQINKVMFKHLHSDLDPPGTPHYHRSLFRARRHPTDMYLDNGNTLTTGTEYTLQRTLMLVPGSEGWLPWLRVGEAPPGGLTWLLTIKIRNLDQRVRTQDLSTGIYLRNNTNQLLYSYQGHGVGLSLAAPQLVDLIQATEKLKAQDRLLRSVEKTLEELEKEET